MAAAEGSAVESTSEIQETNNETEAKAEVEIDSSVTRDGKENNNNKSARLARFGIPNLVLGAVDFILIELLFSFPYWWMYLLFFTVLLANIIIFFVLLKKTKHKHAIFIVGSCLAIGSLLMMGFYGIINAVNERNRINNGEMYLTVYKTEGGTIHLSGERYSTEYSDRTVYCVDAYTQPYFYATTEKGYLFDGFETTTSSGRPIDLAILRGGSNFYEFEMPHADIVLRPTFNGYQNILAIDQQCLYGEIEPDGDLTEFFIKQDGYYSYYDVPQGIEFSLTAVPYSSYEFVQWNYNFKESSSEISYYSSSSSTLTITSTIYDIFVNASFY